MEPITCLWTESSGKKKQLLACFPSLCHTELYLRHFPPSPAKISNILVQKKKNCDIFGGHVDYWHDDKNCHLQSSQERGADQKCSCILITTTDSSTVLPPYNFDMKSKLLLNDDLYHRVPSDNYLPPNHQAQLHAHPTLSVRCGSNSYHYVSSGTNVQIPLTLSP